MMTKKLLCTFDYELFLGNKSGSAQECIINWTNELIKVLDEFGVKAIFFVDTSYLFKLRENFGRYEACRTDYESIKNQLQNLIRKGHYLFPHIHMHWLDAKYFPDQNQWELSNIKRYRFHNTSPDDRKLLFEASFKILNEIISPVKPDYKINAYRAGGWSLQPFDDYKPFFEQYGIQYDFSVMPGMFQFSNAQYYDFTRNPGKVVYRFDEDVMEENSQGRFIELTSTVLKIPSHITKMNRFLLRFLRHFSSDKLLTRGEGQRPIADEAAKPLVQTNPVKSKFETASIELLSILKLKTYLSYFEEHDYMQFVSHPKMLTQHTLGVYKKFLGTIHSKYKVETDLTKIISELKLNDEKIRKNGTEKSVIDVSVIIPCYNVEQYIDDCLDTVFSQELSPLEVICVDDGSTDRTLEILHKYKSLYPDKFHILINEGNRGATYSRNRGLVMAQSEYLNFFDADDLMLPHKLKHQVELLESLKSKPDILVSSVIKKYVNGTELIYNYREQNVWNALMNAMLGVTSSILFKRTKVLEVQGWSENLKSSQEYDLMFRMLMAEATVNFDQTIVCLNRERASGSISKTNPKEKWRRYIDLRIRIYEYLESTGKVIPQIQQTFVNVLFTAIRIYYQYDREQAIKLHEKYIKPLGIPRVTNAISAKYLRVYRLFGFDVAQKMSEWMAPSSKVIH